MTENSPQFCQQRLEISRKLKILLKYISTIISKNFLKFSNFKNFPILKIFLNFLKSNFSIIFVNIFKFLCKFYMNFLKILNNFYTNFVKFSPHPPPNQNSGDAHAPYYYLRIEIRVLMHYIRLQYTSKYSFYLCIFIFR